MASKLKIKLGQIEIDYEGEEKFLKEELPQLLKAVTELHKEIGDPVEILTDDSPRKRMRPKGDFGSTSTSIIAQKLGASTGPSLATAAAGYLCLVSGKESFTRKELTDEMKKAKTFFKANYVGNLTKILKGLSSAGKFNELAVDVYSLGEIEKNSIESRLRE